MPWINVWVPPNSNNALPVLKDLPENAKLYGGRATVDRKPYYKCTYCDGWIEGSPDSKQENTLGPLCGRCGTVLSCIRCGQEIDFFGVIS